jgi:lipoyl-dependent peroxiredoxin
MSRIDKVMATGKTITTYSGDRVTARGRHSRLDLELSSPGDTKPAHVFEGALPHPTAEQLFAGAWSACYTIAIAVIAQDMKVELPSDTSVQIEADLGVTGKDYFLQARFFVNLPGMNQDLAEAIAHKADQVCPYSKAVRGNIDVALNVITS